MASTVSFKKVVPPPTVGNPVVPPGPQPVTQPPPSSATAVPLTTPPPVPDPAARRVVPPPQNGGTLPASSSGSSTQITTEDYYEGVGFQGEWSSKDMATPYLTLVGKTSKAFDEHSDWLGQWLYDKEYPLGEELRVVFIRATKWFTEDLPFGVQQIPQRFARMADARAAGFNESTLKDTAELDLLVEIDLAIEGATDIAHITDEGKGYILARYSVQSTAYGKTAGILAKDMGGFLKGSLINGFYQMTSIVKTSPKGTYYVPVLKTDGKTPDSLKQKIIERMKLANKKSAVA